MTGKPVTGRPAFGGILWRVPSVLLTILALPGSVATHVVSLSPPCWQSLPSRPRGADGSASLPAARWGQCLGDAQLSALIARALATAPSPPSAQDNLSAEIADRYITLRAQQTALVLLAERENLDSQLVVMARRRFAAGTALRPVVAAAEARLSDTRADQARTRAAIASLRVRLAVLTGSALATLDGMPGGPIPLPPALPAAGGRDAALAAYRAAVAAAADAQAKAMDARSAATLAQGDALEADRRALEALQAEEQARGAMAEAYVALARRSER